MSKKLIGIGRKIAYLLRHNPEDLTMDKNGWVDVNELINKLSIDIDTLKEVVITNDKKRYTFNDDETKIRALQGHSIDIEPILTKTVPPKTLYHGTSPSFLDSILNNGLSKMKRQHVHLSGDIKTAYSVGKRHSKSKKPVIIMVAAKEMDDDGFDFYLSDNGVWLTDNVPTKYIIK
jgi:putative RNA 2'-phosphotransferase